MNLQQYEFLTDVSTIYIVACEDRLRGIHWKLQSAPLVKVPTPLIAKTIRQLEEYWKGERTSFDIPLEMNGTPFQEKVWKALQEIPYGKTLSYAEVARRIKHPKAVRAVGSANGKNPISIIVPCHRVIASDGTLGGYGGGLGVKTRLLSLERRI